MTEDAPVRSGAGRWVVIGLALLGVAALAFAIGRFSMFGTAAGGVSTPGTDSPEAGFSRDMQVHHAQAVDMAMEVYRKTDDDDLRVLAYDIATAQSGQKGELYDWLVQWGLPQTGGPLMNWMAGTDAGHGHGAAGGEEKTDAELREEMGMATDAELAALADATGAEADCLFLELMIRHHEGAIPMADALLELGTDPRALVLAKGVKDSQSVEIGAMESMQLRLGCTTG